mmetsp:Transcript_129290/g.258161  ORF Transcript_129290/g.258161 Transcript_129290/m.258161 type:complete len:206 (-) Transcript_129290:140-757(-)
MVTARSKAALLPMAMLSAMASDLPLPQDHTCQCEGGDYWCSTDQSLHNVWNCSGSSKARAIWRAISKVDQPSTAQCRRLTKVCDGSTGAHGVPLGNVTCDDSCYDFCWKKDVGDCADMDAAQIFCVGECMAYCVAERCRKPKQWSSCETSCNAKHMEVPTEKINFVDYAMCMADCAPVPISPYQQHSRTMGFAKDKSALGEEFLV